LTALSGEADPPSLDGGFLVPAAREGGLEMVYKLPEYPKDYAMMVVCAWCGAFLYWSRCNKPNQTSHGICDTCQIKQFEKQLSLPGVP